MMKTKTLRYHGLWLALGWLWIALVIYLSLTPHPPEIHVSGGDKIGHTLAYACLMLWFMQIYQSPSKQLRIAIGFCLLGVAIEFAQEQTGYRAFEYLDMLADAAGVALGLLLGQTALSRMLKIFERYLPRSI
jgi:VanZ family protein